MPDPAEVLETPSDVIHENGIVTKVKLITFIQIVFHRCRVGLGFRLEMRPGASAGVIIPILSNGQLLGDDHLTIKAHVAVLVQTAIVSGGSVAPNRNCEGQQGHSQR